MLNIIVDIEEVLVEPGKVMQLKKHKCTACNNVLQYVLQCVQHVIVGICVTVC